MEVPSRLYKYMSANTAKLVLEFQKLRWSCPSSFNDINELQRMPAFKPSIDASKDEYLKTLMNVAYEGLQLNKSLSPDSKGLVSLMQMTKSQGVGKDTLYRELSSLEVNLSSLEENLREETERYNNGALRIICLSEDENNEVMWAHYGDNHTGCMFEFKHIEKLDTPFQMAKKVTYTDSTPNLGSALDFLLYDERQELLAKTADAIYYTKTAKWEYEKEWRVMTRRPGEDKKYSDFEFYKEELVSVTFSARIADEDLTDLVSLIAAHYPQCKMYKIQSVKGKIERVEFDG
ncbi:DUF2971 domain-containing protein [Vibrio sp. HI00D65]|uniref:DUF2971 domain-containing protein n=1 Tax=Vibrio sp. HI00D65 TaxID=1822216 RepID=UPI000A55C52D|nr:DUF2971 domain-containing protein [Vibrio sp. HI00D65]